MMTYVFGGLVALVLVWAFAPKLYKKLKVKGSVVAEKVSDLIDNPVEEAKYDISVADKELHDAKLKLADLLADIKTNEHKKQVEEDEVTKSQRLAENYASKNDVDNTTKFVLKTKLAQNRVDSLTKQIEGLNDIASKIRKNISNHEVRVEDAKSKVSELAARYENAKLKDKYVNQEFSDSGLKSLEGFEAKVEKFENKVDSKGEVFGTDEVVIEDSDIQDEVNRLLNR